MASHRDEEQLLQLTGGPLLEPGKPHRAEVDCFVGVTGPKRRKIVKRNPLLPLDEPWKVEDRGEEPAIAVL